MADGHISDWNGLTTCPGIPMYRAGDSGKEHAADAFLDWDCSTTTLCILVKTRTGHFIDDLWFKQDSIGTVNGIEVYADDDGDGVVDPEWDGFGFSPSTIVAWEQCIDMSASCHIQAQFHANYFADGESQTSSTGKAPNSGDVRIALDLGCPCDTASDCHIFNDCFDTSQCDTTTGHSGHAGHVSLIIV